ncbi:unnamed protein product [marine sediment metagenome]|uniref:ABC transmembrane type-1 domain-containing protein n=1 Tax=marine sediment metagenome TaxID=412755 RepID=X1ACR9_9ZZZZ
MFGFLIRLFVKLPLFILFYILTLTVIIPILYWVIFNDDWLFLIGDINEIGE